MRKLIESTYVSLNGLFTGDAWWAAQMQLPRTDRHNAHALELLHGAEGLVLGRATYEVFAQTWPSQTGALAEQLNTLPKYVASKTLTDTTWNAQILPGDAVAAVAELKKQGDGTLVKYGNGSFSRALVEAGLLDELHVWMSPYVADQGQPLLAGIATTFMELGGITEIGNGTVVLAYAPKT
jgi:dihydrofolate reductase